MLVDFLIIMAVLVFLLCVAIPLTVRIVEMQRHGPPIESNDPNDWRSQERIDNGEFK
jgi:hypothetical protein